MVSRELTIRGLILGVLITTVFTAANVYLGLKVGLTFASSIPAAVISMAILSALSAIGLYSVVAYLVSQRTAEIGIRMALGAQPAQVVGLVLRSGMKLVVIGLVLGLAGAAGTARAIQTLLFQVRPIDPVVYAVVVVVFTIVATLACLVPSWRASRIDPLIALRAD